MLRQQNNMCFYTSLHLLANFFSGRSTSKVTNEFYKTTFTAAICPKTNMRTLDNANSIIDELRSPLPSFESIVKLNSRCLPVPQSEPWFPTANGTNSARQHVILAHTVAAARSQTVMAFKAKFTFKKALNRSQLDQAINHLYKTCDSKLQFLPPILYIYLGMRVMITHNCDVAHGVGNGTTGVVCGYVWQDSITPTFDEYPLVPNDPTPPIVREPHHVPKYILIRLTTPEIIRARATVRLHDLPDDVWPLKVVSREINNPKSAPWTHKRLTATMRQFPVVYGDAVTFHKLQGSTMMELYALDP